MKPSTDRSALGLFAAALLVAATSRCVTDHDALAKRDSGGSAGEGGSGGKAGSGAGGNSNGSGGTGGKYTEPAGRSVVTFMHGVVDSERVAFCFATKNGDKDVFVAEPTPASGLTFGSAFHVESLPELDFSEDDITPYVIGGDLDRLDGLDCKEAVALARELMERALPDDGSGGAPNGAGGAPSGEAGAPGTEGGAGGEAAVAFDEVAGAGGAGPTPVPDPPALRVRALPTLPAGTLSAGYSILLVAEGCLGGPWFVDKDDEQVCGEGYFGGTTLASSLVVMSRETSFNMGLQALNASRASGPLDAVISPPSGSVDFPIPLASDIVDGQVAPVPASVAFSSHDYGVTDPGFRVRFVDSQGRDTQASWADLIERSGLDAVEDGKNYVIVALGPSVAVKTKSWWNLSTVGLAAADP
jgi:hypothetical protein